MQLLRYCIVAVSLVSVFVFPWAITRMLMAIVGLVFPPLSLVLGILVDLLYYPGVGVPLGLYWGVGLMLGAYLVRILVKTRML